MIIECPNSNFIGTTHFRGSPVRIEPKSAFFVAKFTRLEFKEETEKFFVKILSFDPPCIF